MWVEVMEVGRAGVEEVPIVAEDWAWEGEAVVTEMVAMAAMGLTVPIHPGWNPSSYS